MIDWKEVDRAFEAVALGACRRIDGDGFKLYAVGSNLIRIDILTAIEVPLGGNHRIIGDRVQRKGTELKTAAEFSTAGPLVEVDPDELPF
jgi:hypothetical protein